jgi:uncharacterized protein YcbX
MQLGRITIFPIKSLDGLTVETVCITGGGILGNDEWNEKIVTIGSEVKLKITGPCGRCVMTTLPQGDVPRDIGILKTAAKHNQARVGAYAAVGQGGLVRRGDSARIEPA